MTEPVSFLDGRVSLWAGDCIEVLQKFEANSFDAVVTDPPYGLEFMGKEWDGADGFRRSLNAADAGRDSVFGRTSKRAPEYRTSGSGQTSKPGIGDRETEWVSNQGWNQFRCGECGHLFHGGSPCQCENPKPVRADNRWPLFQAWCEAWARELLRVLKPGGHMLAFGGTRTSHRMTCAIEDAGFEIRDVVMWLYGSGFPKSHDVSKAIDKAAGAERIRPRHSGVTPFGGPGRQICSECGKSKGGGVGNCRCEKNGLPVSDDAAAWSGWGTALKPAYEPIILARKPLQGTVAANVLTHGVGALNIDGCRVEGRERTEYGLADAIRTRGDVYGEPTATADFDASKGRWPANIILEDDSEEVLAAFPPQAGQTGGRVRNQAPRPLQFSKGAEPARVGTMGHGDSGSAARFFYSAKADADDRLSSKHPTVKPVDLLRWLVRLVTPPGGTVLDCFAGTGTTAEACFYEGFRCTLIEREPEYQADIKRRMELCLAGPAERKRASAKAKNKPVDAGPLFGGGAV